MLHVSTRWYRALFAVIPFLLLLSLFQFELSAIRALNHGRFVYSLDDAYIHLALAERIAQGHYGLNPGEASAPASSILWSFLLAVFARTSFFEYVPLALNLIAAAATLFVYTKILRAALADLPDLHARAAAAWLAVFLIPATNLVGLAFTGMEHSLQLFLCAAILLGVIQVARGAPAPRWFVPALVAAPLVRYECLAVSLPALAFLAASRGWQAAGLPVTGYQAAVRQSAGLQSADWQSPGFRARGFLAAAPGLAAILAPLAGYSLFLHANGLGWLPTSVFAKVSQTGLRSTHNFIIDHFANNLSLRQGQVLGALFVVLIYLGVARRETPRIERLLALGGAAAILAHLAAGQIGWWDRYEIYILATALLLVIFLSRALVQRLFWPTWSRPSSSRVSWLRWAWPPATLAILAGLSALVGLPYFGNLALTPLASANIYEQQYQMHRFVVDYLRAPVAVNDIGWVSFHNPRYVLDLWGLDSPQALANRTAHAGPAWMDQMASQHGVRLVMIYDTWITPRPSTWVPVARMHLGWRQTTAGGDMVSFYALDEAAARQMRPLLTRFKTTLPYGVRMEIEP